VLEILRSLVGREVVREQGLGAGRRAADPAGPPLSAGGVPLLRIVVSTVVSTSMGLVVSGSLEALRHAMPRMLGPGSVDPVSLGPEVVLPRGE